MRILFDQTEAQTSFFNGAAEYAQTVFLTLMAELPHYPDVTLYSLYTSECPFKYERLAPEQLAGVERVVPIDYKGRSLRSIIEEEHIDLLFITCGQSFCELPLGDLRQLPCKVLCTIHDFMDEELSNSRMEVFQFLLHPLRLVRYLLSRTKEWMLTGSRFKRTELMAQMLRQNDADVVTVSDYSRHSFHYQHPDLQNKVHVFAAPEKHVVFHCQDIENDTLRQLIARQEKFLLLLSADRPTKNAERMIRAFTVFAEKVPTDLRLVTVAFGKSLHARHTDLPFLSAADLEQAYQHCHALLYPSFFEGFGYPPLEAMKYGKPVLSSNVCSMPEVLGSAPIYFTPIYETDMFRALCAFSSMSYDTLVERSRQQYAAVCQRQQADLHDLVSQLLDGSFLSAT